MTTARERLAWAVLFSLPVGAGVALATARMARAPPTAPVVVGSGAVTAAILFALVFGATDANDTEPASQRPE